VRFLLGFTIGIAIGLLAAPAPGNEMRRRLWQGLSELGRLPERKAEAFAESAKEKAGELGSRIGRQAAEAAVEAVRNDVLGKKDTA
jgi:gas vesicle protein